ncbi:hypothetical protein IL54_3676 [Sphingobium sp. ba1]|nr:hypothetical protein IL54_3676 [Sphingobium sp. ba1]
MLSLFRFAQTLDRFFHTQHHFFFHFGNLLRHNLNEHHPLIII